MTWKPMDSAPRDRAILIHCGCSKKIPVKIALWAGGWVHSVTGVTIREPTGWFAIPDYSMQPISQKHKKRTPTTERDMAIYKRRKAGDTNEAIGRDYQITKGRVSQIFKKVNKKMFD